MDDKQPKQLTKDWALGFTRRHGRIEESGRLRELATLEQESLTPIFAAIAAMPFDCFATAIVHYTSTDISQQKVRQVEHLAGERVTRREYWNKIDRAHHYIAGVNAAFSAINIERQA